MNKQLIECVPNISEGRDLKKIHQIGQCCQRGRRGKIIRHRPW